MANSLAPHVIVVGGAAGAAIAHKLAEQGKRVTLFCRDDVSGATDNNQKWLHSGLLYPSGELAAKAWKNREADWTIKKRYVNGPEQAHILALKSETVAAKERMWEKWEKEGRAIPEHPRLGLEQKTRLLAAGINFADGWATPDCAIDFPGLVRDMRLNLEQKLTDNAHLPSLNAEGCVMEGARVLRLLRGTSGITGVDFDWQGEQSTLSCDQCVLAAGAWSYDLLKDIGIRLPLIRKKCLILVIENQPSFHVDKITVCLDVIKEDGTISDVSLVPFDGKILAAGTDFRVVYELRDRSLEDLTSGASEVQALKAELSQCFTKIAELRDTDFQPRVCFKTEHYNPVRCKKSNALKIRDRSGPRTIVRFPACPHCSIPCRSLWLAFPAGSTSASSTPSTT